MRRGGDALETLRRRPGVIGEMGEVNGFAVFMGGATIRVELVITIVSSFTMVYYNPHYIICYRKNCTAAHD